MCSSCTTNYSLLASNYTCLLLCPDTYTSVNQTCTPCSSNCYTCSTLSLCLTCPSNLYLFNATCLNPCPSAYYPNTTTAKCAPCHYTCTTCTNTSYCTHCSIGYQLQTNFTCISTCPNYQVPVNGICLNCSSMCSTCQQTTNNCTACYTPYYYAPTQNACYNSCPTLLY